MMKRKIIIMLGIAALLLTACGQAKNTSVPTSETASDTVMETSSESSSDQTSSEPEDTDNNEIGGSYTPCTEHTGSYHYISTRLINYIGWDAMNEWTSGDSSTDSFGRSQDDINIVSFIEHFDIPREFLEETVDQAANKEALANLNMTREEFLEENGYTDSQIDALYSGDQAKINEAFCGEMAYYNPEDGQLYSIYWLSDHTAEEYESAGIPETEVERILGLAEEAGGGYARFAEEAGEAAAEYAAMN